MATTYTAPGVYVEEVAGGAHPIVPLGISTAGFVGEAPDPAALLNVAWPINNWSEFVRNYVPDGAQSTPLSHAVFGYFMNGGSRCYVVNTGKGQPVTGGGTARQGLQVLEQVDEVAIVVCPGYTDPASYEAILSHCENMRDRVAILDCQASVPNIDLLTRVGAPPAPAPAAAPASGSRAASGGSGSGSGAAAQPAQPQGIRPRQSDYGTMYFPWITVRDPLSAQATLVDIAPSGHMAGIWARSDATRGVHKAPANEPIRGALNLTYRLTAAEQGVLNLAGINCFRFFEREGIRVWGARTLADSSSEWRYLNVRRLFIMIEKSIGRSTNWVVFEPNDRTLWKSIRRDVGAFLTYLWRTGALMGRTPAAAFFVKCDEETNPSDVIDLGQVVTLVGIAPVKPAEFVVFRISQWDGGSQVEALGAAA
jgi:phage tail sheath protein FI